jgi:hypothetical protein
VKEEQCRKEKRDRNKNRRFPSPEEAGTCAIKQAKPYPSRPEPMQTTVAMIKRTPALNNAPIPYSTTRTMSTPVTTGTRRRIPLLLLAHHTPIPEPVISAKQKQTTSRTFSYARCRPIIALWLLQPPYPTCSLIAIGSASTGLVLLLLPAPPSAGQ